jgi:hypothetical protein
MNSAHSSTLSRKVRREHDRSGCLFPERSEFLFRQRLLPGANVRQGVCHSLCYFPTSDEFEVGGRSGVPPTMGRDRLKKVNQFPPGGGDCEYWRSHIDPSIYGRIDNGIQRRSAFLFSRICLGDTLVCAARFRLRTCCSQESTEGRATMRSSSARKYSCIDLPCNAARAASSSRTLSGTSRMLI